MIAFLGCAMFAVLLAFPSFEEVDQSYAWNMNPRNAGGKMCLLAILIYFPKICTFVGLV